MISDQEQGQALCIIGIGNEYRGDDAVGLLVARQLKEHHLAGVSVREVSGEGSELMQAWDTADAVFLIDAVSTGAACGTTFRIDARKHSIPSQFFHHSSHAFGVAESIRLANILGRLPQQCILYGIEGKDFDIGTTVSLDVREAVQKVVATVLGEIHAAIPCPVPGP